jgi:hypothetical protein
MLVGAAAENKAQNPSLSWWWRLRRWWGWPAIRSGRRVALGGYVVVGLFGLTFWVTQSLAAHPQRSRGTDLVLAAAVTAPVALAFVWRRLSGVKAFGVEITVSAERALEVQTFNLPRLEDVAMGRQIPDSNVGANSVLATEVSKAVIAGAVAMEVDLRRAPYWWPSHIYLLGALLADYSNVRQVVFTVGGERRFVGMCTPAALEQGFGDEAVWFQNDANATARERYKAAVHEAFEGLRAVYVRDRSILIPTILAAWPRTLKGRKEVEELVPPKEIWIGKRQLKEQLKDALVRRRVTDDVPISLAASLLEDGREFVPLVQGGCLNRIVKVAPLALDIARQAMSVASGAEQRKR